MPDRVISAEAVISAKDATGDVFVNIARKLGEIGKGAKASAEVERLSKTLADASKQAEKIGQFRVASKSLDAASLSMAKAKQTAALLAKQIEGMDRPTAVLTGKLNQAEREVTRSTEAFKRQGQAVREARGALDDAGIPLGRLGAEQTRLKGVIEGTTRAIETQIGVERRAAEMAEKVAAAERDRAKAEKAAEVAAHREAERRAEGIAHHGFGHYVAGAAAGAVSAHGVMSALERALEAGAERQTTILGMKNAGMGDDEVRRAVDLATRVSRDAPNLDVSQILELHKEARSAVQHPEEVFELMPDLARATSVLKGMGADNANIADMVKAGESLGLMNDPKRFHGFLDAQVRAMKVMGKTITTEQIYEAAKYSKSAGATLSDDFLNLTLPSLIQEMHGSSAGDALSAIAKRWRGGLAHQHLAVTELNRMGLLEDPSKIVRAKKTGEIMGYTGKLKGDALLGTDPDRFFREVWEPAAEAMGVKTLADKIKLLNETLPGTAANAGRIFLQQAETLKQHRENYRDAPNLERSVELQSHDPKVAMQTFTAALNDLEAAVTGPTMDALSLGLGRFAGVIRDLADAAKAHPDLAVGAGAGLAGAALAGSGALAYYVSTGFGLPSAARQLTVAADAIIAAEHGGHGAPGLPPSGDDVKKPGGTSFGAGRWLAFGAGLAGVVLNAPGMDEAGDRERDANSKALDALRNPSDAISDYLFGKGRKAGDAISDAWARMHTAGVPLPPDRDAYSAPNTDGNALHRWDEVGPPRPAFHPDDRRDRSQLYARPAPTYTAPNTDGNALHRWDETPPAAQSFWHRIFGAAEDPAREAGEKLAQLGDRSGLVLTSFEGLNGAAGTAGAALGTLGGGVGSASHELEVLALAARTASTAFASLLAAAGAAGGAGVGENPGVIRASFGGGAGGGVADGGVGGVGGAGIGAGGPAPSTDAMPNRAGGPSAPGHIDSQLRIGDHSYRFGSGGVRGSASIPFGDYPITPSAMGSWGVSHGAIGVNGNRIWDARLGRYRTGILLHAGAGTSLITEGCMAFLRQQFPKVKAEVFDMIRRNGHAYLHVGPHGATITPEAHPALAGPALRRRTPDEHGAPAGHAITAKLDRVTDKLDRVASAVERGGLHRIHVALDKGLSGRKAYQRGSVGATVA